jgi:hypothetical protein
MPHFNNPLDALRYHVSGAIERGEGEAITAVDACTPEAVIWQALTDNQGASRPKQVDAIMRALTLNGFEVTDTLPRD